jgi:hypothetical protein
MTSNKRGIATCKNETDIRKYMRNAERTNVQEVHGEEWKVWQLAKHGKSLRRRLLARLVREQKQ